MDKLENVGYTLYHRLWILNPKIGTRTLKGYFKFKDSSLLEILNVVVDIGKYPVTLRITCISEDPNFDSVIKTYNIINGKKFDKEIDTIIFEFTDGDWSPAIAMHWTYLKITISLSNFSFKGNSLCDRITNPCISGYYCSGGVCKRCHPSCFDCVNGALSTDCYSKCNTHAVTPTPEKGSCSIGYVDLNQFEDFKIENMVPPPRNNRLTISFWMFFSEFPTEDKSAFLKNSFSEDINIEFKFSNSLLTIKCAGKESEIGPNNKNTWFYVKCAISKEKDYPRYLYTKAFNAINNNFIYKNETYFTSNNDCGHEYKKYYEPDDYITLDFLNFNQLQNKNFNCHVYMKQLVLFREYLPEPYDNKYFNMEKLVTGNTIELPELLFIALNAFVYKYLG